MPFSMRLSLPGRRYDGIEEAKRKEEDGVQLRDGVVKGVVGVYPVQP